MGDPQSNQFPPAPPGYQPASRFEYPTVKLQVAALLVLAAITPILLLVAGVLHPQLARDSFARWNDGISLLIVIGTVIATAVVHELVHGVAYKLLGYKVTFGVSRRLLAAYAAAFGQWQKRNHNIIVALAPLVVLTGVFSPLLLTRSREVLLVAVATLMMNTAGATGDLYLTWRLMQMPKATLLHDVDIKTMLIYLPEDAGVN
jgi:hypothetical protein